MGEYKLINLRKDYYNDITIEELRGLYSVKNEMRKFAWKETIINCFFALLLTAFLGWVMYMGFKTNGWKFIFHEMSSYFFFSLFAIAEIIIIGTKELGRWSDFFFGKGKIISLESEFFEGTKQRPEGYYRHTLTIAVSETEAVGNIFYFSDEPWESEKYIGKDAAAVYFPKAHLLYAVIDGEDAEKYTEEFSEMMFLKKRKKD